MGQALYRKYRTKTLAETVGQEHVTTTLANALKQGRISHAYLLSGPRGTGKTSIARILAHEINGLPYDDAAHLDIIEIDAASNRRIDEIRDLRERVNVAPSSAKYKVYIIDEVHMLTKEAFNALLKTLEEPPAHVVFILATTEAHKLPGTILSRTQHFTLRPAPLDLVVQRLRTIAGGESISIDDDALELIAEHGEGSFRDSISLLDQAGNSSSKVTRSDVERILGLAPDTYITHLHDALQAGNHTAVVTTLGDLHSQGFEPAAIASQLSTAIRTELLAGHSTNPTGSLDLLKNLIDIPASRSPGQLLEITLLQAALPPAGPSTTLSRATTPQKAATRTTTPANEQVVSGPSTKAPAPAAPIASPSQPVSKKPASQEAIEPSPPERANDLAAVNSNDPITDPTELWHQVLEAIKKQYNTLYGIARMAHPELDGQRLTLTFRFAFHQKRINEAKNRKLLTDVVERLAGQPIEIRCIVADTEPAAVKPDIAAISNIFGGAELVES